METLHKIAGVSEAQRSDAASPPPPAQTAVISPIPPPPPPPPVPAKDDARSIKSSKSTGRASLPLNRRKSQKSFQSGRSVNSARRSKSLVAGDAPPTPRLNKNERNTYGDLAPQHVQSSRQGSTFEGENEAEEESDFEWGPQHPCFPHPNPHCVPNSQEAAETRVIRVKRDYLIAGDLYPQYANLYPEILDPMVTDEEFRDVIQQINTILLKAFSPDTFRAWADAILGVATGYLWDDLGLTGARSGEKELERYINRWNTEREKEGREVKLIQPRTTGFMTLDFVVPDPGIDIAVEESDGEEEEAARTEYSAVAPSTQRA